MAGKTVFRNGRVALLMLLGVLFGAFIAYSVHSQAGDVIGLCVAVYSLYAALVHYLGVVVDGNAVWMPLPIIPILPIVVIGRRRVLAGDIGYIIATGKSMGLETVAVDTADVMHRVLFLTREQRLAFFDAVKAVRPDILIYRSRGD